MNFSFSESSLAWRAPKMATVMGADFAGRFNQPAAVATDGHGNIFVVDTYNQLIRRIGASGAISTIGGLVEAPGSADGTGINARLFDPRGIAVDANGNLYIGNGTTIRKGTLAPAPTISVQPLSQTVAAGGSVSFSITANGDPAPTYQ